MEFVLFLRGLGAWLIYLLDRVRGEGRTERPWGRSGKLSGY